MKLQKPISSSINKILMMVFKKIRRKWFCESFKISIQKIKNLCFRNWLRKEEFNLNSIKKKRFWLHFLNPKIGKNCGSSIEKFCKK